MRMLLKRGLIICLQLERKRKMGHSEGVCSILRYQNFSFGETTKQVIGYHLTIGLFNITVKNNKC